MNKEQIMNAAVLSRIKEINDSLTSAVRKECSYFDVWMKLYDCHILTLKLTDGIQREWYYAEYDLAKVSANELFGVELILRIIYDICQYDFEEQGAFFVEEEGSWNYLEFADIVGRWMNLQNKLSICDFE